MSAPESEADEAAGTRPHSAAQCWQRRWPGNYKARKGYAAVQLFRVTWQV